MRRLKSLASLGNVRGRRVLLRSDLNVPLEAGNVGDDSRLVASIPTLEWLTERGARVLITSHLGKPKKGPDPALSLAPVARRLAELSGLAVAHVPECIGPQVASAAARLADGAVLCLENLRFHRGEEQGDPTFAAALAATAEVYVGDAFGAAHRPHASISIVPGLLPSAAGLLLAREVEALDRVLTDPAHPFVTILGGAKVSDKIGVIASLIERCDVLMVGGGMAYSLLAAQGVPVGASKVEPADVLAASREVLARAAARGVDVLLPVDHVAADRFAADAATRVVTTVPEGWLGLDIGPATRAAWVARLKALAPRTVMWNGPLGVFEWEAFSAGTTEIARLVGSLASATTVVGGGETVMACQRAGVTDRITHVSTGGGASLEFLEGKALPGVVALEEAS